jgi:hypothetical protein
MVTHIDSGIIPRERKIFNSVIDGDYFHRCVKKIQ